jgi:hypothetical protein
MSNTISITVTDEQLKAIILIAEKSGITIMHGMAKAAPASAAKDKKEKKEKKVRDPDAPKKEPNDWIKFTGRVRTVISNEIEGEMTEKGVQKKPHPKAVTQTASSLKEKGSMATATDEQIVEAYKAWLANPPEKSKMELNGTGKKAKKDAVVEASEAGSDDEEKEKAKKVRKPQSEETKKAAAAKRAATKAAKAAAPVVAPAAAAEEVEEMEEEAEEEKAEAADEISDFEPFVFNKKSYLKNGRGDVLTEGMEWVGRYDAATKKLAKIAKPADLDI